MRAVLASYDGVLAGPARSQTVPYVRGLAARGHDVVLLSYERPELLSVPGAIDTVREALADVPWVRIPWRRSAPGDLAAGLRALRRVVREHRADLVHARGYVPALLARTLGIPFVFDMRGFWPDERVDGGLWQRSGAGYRTWKRIERSLCRRAGSVVVLTARARGELRRLGLVPEPRPVHVVPTCVDLARFRPVPEAERPEAARGPGPRFVILGGTSTWYLPDAMLDLGALALSRDPCARLHVLTEDDPEPVLAGLRTRRIDPARALVRAVPHADVASWISGAAAGIALLRAAWSKSASCPTKLAEFLACGVPVVMTAGIGDVDAVLDGERVGVTVAVDGSHGVTLDRLDEVRADPTLPARCRAVAEAHFSVAQALPTYERAYEECVATRAVSR